MNNIYLLQGFNNYFNRKLKYFADLESYLNAAEYDSFSRINFNPSDGVRTTHLIGSQTQVLSGIPDYFLVTDDADQIVSRWFVTEADYTRNGQYKLTLKRDTLADHYNLLLNTPIFVEKGMLDLENPLIFNNEGNHFNQIKKSEHLLKDETKTNWIVGYIGQDTKPIDNISSTTVSTSKRIDISSLALDYDPDHPENGATFREIQGNVEFSGEVGFTYYYNTNFNGTTQIVNALFNGDGISHYNGATKGRYSPSATWHFGLVNPKAFGSTGAADGSVNKWGEVFRVYYGSVMRQPFLNYLLENDEEPITLADKNEIMALNGKTVFSAKTGKTYKLTIGGYSTSNNSIRATPETSVALYSAFNTMKKYFFQGLDPDYYSESYAGDPYLIKYTVKTTAVTLEEVPAEGTIYTKISGNRQHLIDAPFDMFAIPYSLDNLNLATQIGIQLGQGLYDIQLVPYCPVRELVSSNGVNLKLGKEGFNFDYIKVGGTGVGVSYILWATQSSDSFTITHRIAAATDPIELKVQNECEMYRISSPNYNGIYEFSVAKNRGVDYFEVNFTYKPYSPYIHVCPNFKGLYGDDFNDSRGLICNGDFSIAMISDAWRQYEINNKNYQNIFNTEIKTMDAMNTLGAWSQGISSVLGAGAAGTGVGLLTGSPLGGAIAGGASLIGGMADLGINQAMYRTQKEAKLQMYNFQLGNIKARPDSLTKVSAYNINNKYFPFVELYSATDVEKQALREKIKYDGMTVMAIGKPIDYVGTGYFKGQLIRCDTIKDDSHVIEDIYNELNQGVYLNG